MKLNEIPNLGLEKNLDIEEIDKGLEELNKKLIEKDNIKLKDIRDHYSELKKLEEIYLKESEPSESDILESLENISNTKTVSWEDKKNKKEDKKKWKKVTTRKKRKKR